MSSNKENRNEETSKSRDETNNKTKKHLKEGKSSFNGLNGLFKNFKNRNIGNFFDKNYKKLMIIPFAFIIFSIIVLIISYATTGEIIHKGITLKGGISITLNKNLDISPEELQSQLETLLPDADVIARIIRSTSSQSYIIEAGIDESEADYFLDLVKQTIGELKEDEYSLETISSSLSENFFRQVLIALLLAFIMMGVVVILYFKKIVPSVAVILSAVFDIIGTIAITNLLGMRISTAGIAGFLMLIGYSVDSDILLTTRLTKNKIGTIFERTKDAFSTGIMMSLTTLIAITIALILSSSDVIIQIMAIVFIGLIIDLMNTWLMNVGILRMHLEKKGDK
ncbi:MAG: preprotein translocase subunit SecF [Candidatus Woesearchaeota archaeon]|nr:preprotein translocase subunit SecF [Candidatus Woesearchaeota archaeon]MDK2907777.1 preprotein translocase subunit SecF [Candidatus Woesearchaeota archaeon]